MKSELHTCVCVCMCRGECVNSYDFTFYPFQIKLREIQCTFVCVTLRVRVCEQYNSVCVQVCKIKGNETLWQEM